MTATAKLVGVGVGPGDPELLTLKAVRALQAADVVSYFAKAGRPSTARTIAAAQIKPDVIELPLFYPVTSELPHGCEAYQDAIGKFFDTSAALIAAHLDRGRTVAVLCEGDPLFYGSYMHLHARLTARYPGEVIAGVSGMSGCWSAVGAPIAQGDDVFMVIPGTLPQSELERRLEDASAAVVMKLGRNLPKVRRALERTGDIARAIYVERGTMADTVVMPLAAKNDDDAPYFAMVLLPGWERGR